MPLYRNDNTRHLAIKGTLVPPQGTVALPVSVAQRYAGLTLAPNQPSSPVPAEPPAPPEPTPEAAAPEPTEAPIAEDAPEGDDSEPPNTNSRRRRPARQE